MVSKNLKKYYNLIDKFERVILLLFVLFSILLLGYSFYYGQGLTLAELQIQLIFIIILFIMLAFFSVLLVLNLILKAYL